MKNLDLLFDTVVSYLERESVKDFDGAQELGRVKNVSKNIFNCEKFEIKTGIDEIVLTHAYSGIFCITHYTENNVISGLIVLNKIEWIELFYLIKKENIMDNKTMLFIDNYLKEYELLKSFNNL